MSNTGTHTTHTLQSSTYPVRVPLFVQADHAGNRRLSGGQGARLVKHDRRRLSKSKKARHRAPGDKKKQVRTGCNTRGTRVNE